MAPQRRVPVAVLLGILILALVSTVLAAVGIDSGPARALLAIGAALLLLGIGFTVALTRRARRDASSKVM